jgi:cytochrome P450
MSLLYTILSGVNPSEIFTTLLSIIILYIIHFYYKHFTRINPLPGPLPVPLIGSFEIFKNDIDAWFFRLNKNIEHDGLFELNIAGNRQVVITRAEYVEKFLASNSSSINHIMRTANNGLLSLFDLEKKGVGLNHDYQRWKLNRHIFSQAVMPLSSTSKPSKYANLLFEEMAGYWIDLIQKNEDSVTIDISTWMRRFTSDFISLLTTGKQMSTIYYFYRKMKNEEITKEMIDSENFIESINVFVSDNQILFVPKLLRNFPLIKNRVDNVLGTCHYFYDKLVEIVRKRRKEIQNSDGVKYLNPKEMDLLTTLIVANTPNDPHQLKNLEPELLRPLNDDEIRGVMFDAFVAGTDTVSLFVKKKYIYSCTFIIIIYVVNKYLNVFIL